MRVLFVESAPGYGGSMQSLLELVAHLHNCIEPVVTASYDVRQYRRVPERAKLVQLSLPPTWGRHGYVRLLTYQLGWYRVVRKLICQVKPDLVHLNNLFFDTFGGAIAAKRAGLSAVAHARGFLQSRRLARYVARWVDFHIAISKSVANNLLKHGVHPECCRVIYNPIAGPSQPLRKGCVHEVPVVGMLGMLQPWKGQHVFVEALHLVKEKGISVRGVIAGSEPFGRQGYLDRLKQMIHDYGLGGDVLFTGYVRDPFAVLAEWDVSVHASIEPEPLGRTVVESMLSGVAVVATAGGGVPEFVEDGVTGLLVPMGDASALADAIRRLLADSDLRQRLAEAGQRRAREMFDPVKHAREVEEVYRTLDAL